MQRVDAAAQVKVDLPTEIVASNHDPRQKFVRRSSEEGYTPTA